MKNYEFTYNWFISNDLEQFLPIKTDEELHILEIGSFEGQSTVWFIENYADYLEVFWDEYRKAIKKIK